MPQDNIEEIKGKIDVVDLIQEYIQLKPAGINNFKANCPFHNEKTPSFMVSRDKQIWHCFGCAEGGDIFAFVQKMEGMDFPEALRMLAKKAGVQLQYQDPAVHNQKTRLMDICKEAANFYHKLLVDHPKAEFVRTYLKKREVKEETIEEWKLGFAPDAWDTLNSYLVKKKYNEEDIFLAGLTIKKERGVGYNDRFRNRLIFPISDMHGNIIGFGGRWLGQEENVAKYINSPQTIIYNKSYVLYGLDKARQEIKKQKLAVVVEGYMDCLSSHQAGVVNVVASSGTALTSEQVKMLKRYTTNLAFAFDQDAAGESAAKRGIETAWQEEMNTKIIQLSDAKDPDDLIKKNVSLWSEAISNAQSVMDYYFESTLIKYDTDKVDDKKEIAKELLPVISKLADTIEQTHYLQRLAVIIKVDEKILRDKLAQIISDTKVYNSGEQPQSEPVSQPKERYEILAEVMVGAMLNSPKNMDKFIEQLPPEYMPAGDIQKLYKNAIIYYTKKHNFDYNDFIKTSLSNEQKLAVYANVLSLKASDLFGELDEESYEKEVVNNIKELKKQAIHKQLTNIEDELRQAEEVGDNDALNKYSQKFSELANELKHLE